MKRLLYILTILSLFSCHVDRFTGTLPDVDLPTEEEFDRLYHDTINYVLDLDSVTSFPYTDSCLVISIDKWTKSNQGFIIPPNNQILLTNTKTDYKFDEKTFDWENSKVIEISSDVNFYKCWVSDTTHLSKITIRYTKEYTKKRGEV